MIVNRAFAAGAAAAVLCSALISHAQSFDLIVLHNDPGSPTGDGAISRLNGATLATTLSVPAIGEDDRGMFAGAGFLARQSDGTIVGLINGTDDPNTPTTESDNGIYTRRFAATLSTIGGEEGAGVPGSSLLIYNDKPNSGNANDFVFLGFQGVPGVVSNTQIRVPDLSAISQQNIHGLNGGPGQFGDGPMGPAVLNSAGDLIFLYEDGLQNPSGQGRIRRSGGGHLINGAGDQGLGETAGVPNFGVTLNIQSNDRLVVGKSNGVVELRLSNSSLSIDLGGFERNTSQLFGFFDAPIGDVALLSDDRVVVGLDNGQLFIFGADLQTRPAMRTLGAAVGDFSVTSLAVSANNDILVGTEQGSLFQLDTTLTDKIEPRTGLGRIADILAIPSGGTGPLAGDYDNDGTVDGDDLMVWQGSFGQTGASLAADGDGNSQVDGHDFLIWQRAIGSGGAAVAATATVPEPMSGVLAAIAAMGALAIRRRAA